MFKIISMKKTTTLLILSFLLSLTSFAQEENEEGENEGKIHKVALVFGYTHIPSAFENGLKEESVFVPTIGLDYFMQFAKGWKVCVVLVL